MSKPQSYPAIVRRWTAHVSAGRTYMTLPVGEAKEYEDGTFVLTFITLPVHNSTWDAKVWLQPCDEKGRPLSSPARRRTEPTSEEGEMRDREAETDGFAGVGGRGGTIQAQTQNPPPPPPEDPTVAEPGHGVGSGGGRGGDGGGESGDGEKKSGG